MPAGRPFLPLSPLPISRICLVPDCFTDDPKIMGIAVRGFGQTDWSWTGLLYAPWAYALTSGHLLHSFRGVEVSLGSASYLWVLGTILTRNVQLWPGPSFQQIISLLGHGLHRQRAQGLC